MQINNIINKTLLGGLALLLATNADAQWWNPFNKLPTRVVENYLNALRSGDVERLKECSSYRRLKSFNVRLGMAITNRHYGDAVVESYIPQEKERYKEDLENIVWILHTNKDYHRVSLIKEEDKWKVDDISQHFRNNY